MYLKNSVRLYKKKLWSDDCKGPNNKFQECKNDH